MVFMKAMYRSEVIQVIQTTRQRGDGTEADPIRVVTEYWSFDGRLLAERDPGVGETIEQRESMRDALVRFHAREGAASTEGGNT